MTVREELERQEHRRLNPLAAFAEKILDQTGYLEYLKEQGYRAVMCRGWRQAADVIQAYLVQKKE